LPDGGSWIGDGGCVVVVVVVVEAVVVGAACVVVGAEVDVGRCTVDNVVVELWRYHRPWLYQVERLRRCADATGIEIASTTDTAVITTIAVRSLRLILTLLSRTGLRRVVAPGPSGARQDKPGGCHAASHGIRIDTGHEPPDGRGPNVRDHGMNRVNAM
jgi:hypothetical protein